MLTIDEKKYLKTILKSKKVRICSYNPKAKQIAERYIAKINQIAPELKVLWIGASALKISGQKDIDINILCLPIKFATYLPKLRKIFSNPKSISKNFIEWNLKDSGYDIEIYLTDPENESLKRQIKVFEILKNDKKLLKQYEDLKQSFNGKSYHDYQKAKYEFYNKILNVNL